MYELLKTIHILAAMAWVGGVILGQVQGARLGRSQDPARFLAYAQEQTWLGKHFYAPASVIVLLAGIGMVAVSGWEFADPWIIIGIVLFAATVILGMLFLSPLGEKIVAGLTSGEGPTAALQADVKRIKLLSQIDLVLLVLVVINMVVKPGA